MNFKVNISEELNDVLKRHLIRRDGQEDLCFALYNSFTGNTVNGAVLKTIIFPVAGERDVHGNVSFNSAYFDRVIKLALEQKCGICFMHSHPASGWQGMSRDDVETENMLAPRCKAVTGLPLLGMTIGNDGTWSARFWQKDKPKTYARYFCSRVCISGKALHISYNDNISLVSKVGEEFMRTVSAWGVEKQNHITRLKVVVVGLGSVGSIIAEALVKTGVVNIVLIDFDTVEKKNMDRLQGIGPDDIGRLKVEAIREHLYKVAPTKDINIEVLPYSIVEELGMRGVIDGDVVFSCVDRPWPRYVLNQLAYANCIPIIDGGIDANQNSKKNNIGQARWKAHTVGSGRICLACLGQFLPEDVSLEMSGLLEDQHYIKGLPEDHFAKRGENVFAFSLGLAGMEIQQFLSLVLQPKGIYYGAKEFDFITGNIDFDFASQCKNNCEYVAIQGEGDKINQTLFTKHPIAEEKRRIAIVKPTPDIRQSWLMKTILKISRFELFSPQRNTKSSKKL